MFNIYHTITRSHPPAHTWVLILSPILSFQSLKITWKLVETPLQLRSTADASTCNTVDDTAWLRKHGPTVDVVFRWQLVNFFGGADVPRQAPVRPARRDETVWTPPDLRRGKRGPRGGRLVPAGPFGRIWVVDGWMWTEISRMASALHTHTHTHTYIYQHTHTDTHTQHAAEISVFRAELQLSSFFCVFVLSWSSEGAKSLNFTLKTPLHLLASVPPPRFDHDSLTLCNKEPLQLCFMLNFSTRNQTHRAKSLCTSLKQCSF